MKRVAVFASLAVLAALGGPAGPGSAQSGPGSQGRLIITNAASVTYPSPQAAVYVCIDGASQGSVLLGSTIDVEQDPGDVTVTVNASDPDCSATPDQSATVTLVAGELQGLAIGIDTMTSFVYDQSCLPAGTSRIHLINGSSLAQEVDLYAVSQTVDRRILLAADLEPGGQTQVPGIPADTYEFEAFSPGVDPYTSAPVALYGGIELPVDYQAEVFLVGTLTNDNQTGSFDLLQGPAPCETETEATAPSTTVAPTTTAVAPGGASPAVPVSGTAAYTG